MIDIIIAGLALATIVKDHATQNFDFWFYSNCVVLIWCVRDAMRRKG